jgi:hypothetical protein
MKETSWSTTTVTGEGFAQEKRREIIMNDLDDVSEKLIVHVGDLDLANHLAVAEFKLQMSC